MPIDLYSFVRSAAILIAVVIVALGLVRAVEMGRGFVNRLYRGRAFWTAAVMLLVMVALSFAYTFGSEFGFVSVVPIGLLVLVLFVFADRTIQVAAEMDFFHRNTLHWRQVKKPLYVVLLADIVLISVEAAYPRLEQGSAGAVFFPLFVFGWATFFGLFGAAIVAVAVSAGRTPDRTIKRHVRLFGIFLVGFFVAFFTSQPGIGPAVNLASDFIIVAAAYSLYLMVMSLSPVGRVEREEAKETVGAQEDSRERASRAHRTPSEITGPRETEVCGWRS